MSTLIEPRETPKGYAIDLGTVYAYRKAGSGITFYWGVAEDHPVTFQNTDEVIDFFSDKITTLEKTATLKGVKA